MRYTAIPPTHFRTLHGKLSVTIVDQPGEATDAFVVVINDLGQHSLWRAGVTAGCAFIARRNPSGKPVRRS